MDVLADTVFLIDLWREARFQGPATAYARAHSAQQAAICWVVAGEFLGGAVAAKQDASLAAEFLSRYTTVHSDEAVVRAYSETYARLREQGRLIGPNDLWIAAVALARRVPLLTRNTAEFRRVDGVEVIDYSAA